MSVYCLDTNGKTNNIHLVNGAVKVYGEPLEFYMWRRLVGTTSTAIVLPNARSLTLEADGTALDLQYHLKHDPDYVGEKQVLSNTIVGTFTKPGVWITEIEGDSFNDGTLVSVNATIAGAQQTIQCALSTGTCTTAGDLDFVFTSALYNGGTAGTITIPIGTGQTQDDVVGSLWMTLIPAEIGTTLFTTTRLTGDNKHIIQIKTNSYLANDSTMAVSWAPTAKGSLVVDGTWEGTHTVAVVGTAISTRAQAALIIGTALGAESDVTDFFAISYGTDANGTQAVIKLTCGTYAANDTTLNFAFVEGTAEGPSLTTSTITTAGTAPNDQIWFSLADATTLEVTPPYLTANPFGTIWVKGTDVGLVYLSCWGDADAIVTNESMA